MRNFPLTRQLTADEKKWVILHHGLTVCGDDDEIALHETEAWPWVFGTSPDLTVRFEIPCSALNEDGTCSLYGTLERPEMCGRWPDAPGQAPDGCLYNDALVGAESR